MSFYMTPPVTQRLLPSNAKSLRTCGGMRICMKTGGRMTITIASDQLQWK